MVCFYSSEFDTSCKKCGVLCFKLINAAISTSYAAVRWRSSLRVANTNRLSKTDSESWLSPEGGAGPCACSGREEDVVRNPLHHGQHLPPFMHTAPCLSQRSKLSLRLSQRPVSPVTIQLHYTCAPLSTRLHQRPGLKLLYTHYDIFSQSVYHVSL